jgi:hypothetical protein
LSPPYWSAFSDLGLHQAHLGDFTLQEHTHFFTSFCFSKQQEKQKRSKESEQKNQFRKLENVGFQFVLKNIFQVRTTANITFGFGYRKYKQKHPHI